MSKNKYMTLDDRYAIEHGFNDRQSFKKIAQKIGKDCTTVSKEVRTHLLFRKVCAPYRHFNDCLKRAAHFKKLSFQRTMDIYHNDTSFLV